MLKPPAAENMLEPIAGGRTDGRDRVFHTQWFARAKGIAAIIVISVAGSGGRPGLPIEHIGCCTSPI
jgi:hypothetical protein